MDDMRAAIYDPYLDSLGGGEKYTLTFVKVLENLGWDVDIWWRQDLREVISRRFGLDLKAKFVRFDPVKTDFWKKKDMTQQYDLLFWVGDGSVPISWAKKSILHMQIPAHWKGSDTLWNKLKAKRLMVVCNSNFTKQTIDKVYGVTSEVLYPPVETSKFKALTKTNTIISIGRISRLLHAKRQDVLVRAFARLVEQYPKLNYRLVLAGGGDDKEYLQHLKKMAHNLPIDFIIDPPASKMQEIVGKSKIFWSATGFEVNTAKQPEQAEHFGIGVVEAMAASCVPIVTRAGGHLETVQENKSGMFWTTIEELVDQTAQLIQEPTTLKEMAYQAHLRSQKFSVAHFQSRVSEIIK